MTKQTTADNEHIIIDRLQMKEITSRLDALIRLQCAVLPDSIGQWDKIKLLNQSGLSSKDIGGILGIRDSSVRSALSRIKEKGTDNASPPEIPQESSTSDGPPLENATTKTAQEP